MNQNFDPLFWANNTGESNNMGMAQKKAMTPAVNNIPTETSGNTAEQMQAVAKEITSRGIDITDGYQNWISVGFAIASEMGEQGRSLFHDLSRMNLKYNATECDKKYTSLLNHGGSGIKAGTFFQMAKNAGIDIARVFKEMLKGFPVSATSSIPPTAKSNEKIEKTPILRVSNVEMADGGMAEVAEMSEALTDGYTFSDKLDVYSLDGITGEIYRQHHSEPAKCDAMILAEFNVISGLMGGSNGTANCRSGIYGIYDGRRVYAPLYITVYSGAGNDKGNLFFAKLLANPVKTEMLRQYNEEKEKYEKEFAEWEAQKKNKDRGPAPKEPEYRSPFVPGNSSSSAVYRAMAANDGWGMMFETEADTVSSMIDSDYGNYSDLMRKAHHHETLSMNRVTDKIHIDIDEPRLSIFLTCTPGQLPALFPSFENGLGSRFLFYNIPDNDVNFHDVFAKQDTPLEDVYKKLGDRLLPLFHAMQQRKGKPLQFVMSSSQQKEFITTYREILAEQFAMLGKGIRAFIFRIALENFRFCMILTALRRLSEWEQTFNASTAGDIFKEEENALVCDDRDFRTAMTIMGSLINHTARVYAVMEKEDKNPFALNGKTPTAAEIKLYEALPEGEFSTSDLVNIAEQLGMSKRTAERALSKLCNVYGLIKPIKRGLYFKPARNNA